MHDDVLRLQHYLKKADAQGIRFCFVVRSGLDNLVSPVEMENRREHFW